MAARLARVDLLALDDWLINPIKGQERRDLLEVIEDLNEQGSTLVTTQLPVKAWHEAIGDPTLADGICDLLFVVREARRGWNRVTCHSGQSGRKGRTSVALLRRVFTITGIGIRLPELRVQLGRTTQSTLRLSERQTFQRLLNWF